MEEAPQGDLHIMAVTKEDLQDFHLFADEKIADGAAQSLEELVDAWSSRRTDEQSVADIRKSIAQYEAGEGLPVAEAFDEIRKKLDWDQ